MEKRKIYHVSTNTDLTEGRGSEYVKHTCALYSTAIRLARNQYVQGSHAKEKVIAFIPLWGIPTVKLKCQQHAKTKQLMPVPALYSLYSLHNSHGSK